MEITDADFATLKDKVNKSEELSAKIVELEKIAHDSKSIHNQMQEDLKLMMVEGANPDAQKEAQRRLLTGTGLYSVAQVEAMLNAEPESTSDPIDDDNRSVDDILRDLGGDNVQNEQVEKLQKQVEDIQNEARMTKIHELQEHLASSVRTQGKQKIIETMKEVAKKRGTEYTELQDDAMSVLLDDMVSKAKTGVMAQARHLGQIPTLKQVDSLLEDFIPKQLTRVRSVISDPAIIGSQETVSGSDDSFGSLPEEPILAVPLKDVISGKVSRDVAQRQNDASRIDDLNRMARNTTTTGATSQV